MKTIYTTLLFLLCGFGSFAQTPLVLPEASQKAEIKQTLGFTEIAIVYHSPLVNGRKIWGGLVPYGKVWRAGANENTTISFTDAVTINGSALPAGTYGLHMIPGEAEWTVIFSKNSTSWGSFFYNEADDALRVKVKPLEMSKSQDWLDYNFTDRTAASCTVRLTWEKLRIPFTVAVDVNAVTLRHIREQLKNLAGFGWHGYEEAAHYCIMNKINYDEALKWINTSIRMEDNFTNEAAKAQLLTLMGDTKGAAEAQQKVVGLLQSGTEVSINAFGYELMNEHDMPTALEVFKLNVKKFPDSWNVYDSLAEAQANAGDKASALTNYKTALSKAPADQQERLKKTIADMQKG